MELDLSKRKSEYIYIKSDMMLMKYIFVAFAGLFGILYSFRSLLGGGTILLVALLVSFFKDGIQVDSGLRKIRVFNSYLFWQWGKWMPLENFKHIVVSHVNGKTKRGGDAPLIKIFLSSVNIYKQQSIVLGQYKSKEDAIVRAEELGQLLGFEVKVNK